MGTNYYHRTAECDRCNRYFEDHIGKSSFGWEFCFQGYDDYHNKGAIRSISDWKEHLLKGKIFDEYDQEISYDDFFKLIQKKKEYFEDGEKPLNNYYYCLAEHPGIMDDEWIDDEGNSFSSAGFS